MDSQNLTDSTNRDAFDICAASASSNQKLYFHIASKEHKTAHVVRADSPESNLAIPGTVALDGTEYLVTSICDEAFYKCTDLTSVAIPDSVSNIGYRAFAGCNGLTTVTIPNSVTAIEKSAFIACSALSNIAIPNSIAYIGEEAFWGCIRLLDSLAKTGKCYKATRPDLTCRDYQFKEGVVNELPETNTDIRLYAYGFHYCDNILSVFDNYYGEDTKDLILWEVEPIGKIIHGGDHKHCCEKIRLVRRIPFSEIGKIVADGLKDEMINRTFTIRIQSGQDLKFRVVSEEEKTVCVFGADFPAGDLVIPKSVIFDGKEYLVTSIGSHAFENCTGLTILTIPESVTSIGDYVFACCSSLTTVFLPDSITFIGECAFAYCRGLTSITIGNSVTNIGYRAFYDCTALTSIIIPDSVTSIEGNAFWGCRGLTSITIPDHITAIGNGAFFDCVGLISKLSDSKKYYKGFDPGLVCRNYHFKEGVVNELNDMEKEISIRECGFHFCDNPLSVFDHYWGMDGNNMELWEVEPMGEIVYGDDHKHCCEKLRLVRRIPFSEIGKIVEESLKEE